MRLSGTAALLALGLLAGNAAGCGPSAEPTPAADPPVLTAAAPGSDSLLTIAKGIMATARFATLVTLGPDGHPQARVVDPFEPDTDFAIRVATNARSRKASEIARDPRVTLLYFDGAGSSYVTVIGSATVVRDSVERSRWWKEEWAAFYQDRTLGADYLLMRIAPTRLEISSERHGIRNDSLTWRPVLVPFP